MLLLNAVSPVVLRVRVKLLRSRHCTKTQHCNTYSTLGGVDEMERERLIKAPQKGVTISSCK